MKITRTTELDHPRTEVFAYLADCRNDPAWCPSVSASTQVAGDGPGRGAEYAQVHKPGPGAPTDLHVEITAYDPPRSMTMRTTDDLGWFDVTYTLEELPGGRTRLTQHDDTHFGWPAKLATPVLYLAIRRGIARQFRELNARLDERARSRA